MSIYRELVSGLAGELPLGRFMGVVVGIVTNNEDPDSRGRVKVKYPWLTEDEESHWARLVTPLAGKERGWFMLPEVGDEVLVAFEHGEMNRPYVLGSLWNGQDGPPINDADGRDTRVLKSRSGHLLRIDDRDGEEKLEIIDKSGKNKVIVDAAKNTVTISADKTIELKAPQGKIVLEAKELELTASSAAKIEASGDCTIKGATVNIN